MGRTVAERLLDIEPDFLELKPLFDGCLYDVRSISRRLHALAEPLSETGSHGDKAMADILREMANTLA